MSPRTAMRGDGLLFEIFEWKALLDILPRGDRYRVGARYDDLILR